MTGRSSNYPQDFFVVSQDFSATSSLSKTLACVVDGFFRSGEHRLNHAFVKHEGGPRRFREIFRMIDMRRMLARGGGGDTCFGSCRVLGQVFG